MESAYAQMTLLKRDQSSLLLNAENITFDKDEYIPITGATSSPTSTDLSLIRRSSRACKGKRYKEFMSNAVMGITRSPSSNKKKRIYESSYSESSTDSQDNDELLSNHQQKVFTQSPSSSSSIMMMDYEPTDHMYASLDQSIGSYQQQQRTLLTTSSKSEELSTTSSSLLSSKPFGAMDYNLEKKILELPAMDLDRYLSRKRDTKHKKKITVRRSINNGASRPITQLSSSTTKIMMPQTIEEARERIKAAVMVGSQKRKARKESITRRVSESTTTTGVIDHEKVNLSSSPPPQPAIVSESTTSASSLFMLATIAEVAANLSDSKWFNFFSNYYYYYVL